MLDQLFSMCNFKEQIEVTRPYSSNLREGYTARGILAEDAGKCGVLATTMIRLGADAMLDF